MACMKNARIEPLCSANHAKIQICSSAFISLFCGTLRVGAEFRIEPPGQFYQSGTFLPYAPTTQSAPNNLQLGCEYSNT
jgi:hypothetical protein